MKAQRAIRNYFTRYKLKGVWWPALLGNHQNQVAVPGQANMVYIRFFDNAEAIVYNNAVPELLDLPVKVGYEDDAKSLRVLGRLQRNRYTEDDRTVATVGKHGETHRWLSMTGIDDPVPVELRQFMPFRIEPAGDFKINVYRGVAYFGTSAFTYDGVQELNLISYLPEGNKECFVLITLDSDGELVLTKGSEVTMPNLQLSNLPEPPANTRLVLGAVRLFAGQTAIHESRIVTDLLDLRFPMWHHHDERYTPASSSTLNDLTDVEITSPTTNELLSYDSVSGMWINRTIVEVGVAPAVHSHVEADITDLDHDAQKIRGVPVDDTNIGDGKALAYDYISGSIIYTDVGGSITVKEIDGSPNVSGVSTINVTNGTLTDNGGGEVTLGIPTTAYQPSWTIRIDGSLTTATDVAGFVVPSEATISMVYIRCQTTGTSGNTIIDVNKNGTTIFTTQANRPTLAYNDSDGIASGVPDVASFTTGDLITIDIDEVATGAANLDVCVVVTALAPIQILSSDVIAIQVFS